LLDHLSSTSKSSICWRLADFCVNPLLRGVSQVCFMDNSFSGLACFIALLSNMPPNYGILCLVGLVASTLVGIGLGAPYEAVRHGLFGYNGMLVGAAVATFSDSGIGGVGWRLVMHSLLTAAAASLASVLSLALAGAWQRQFNLPVFTMPFNLATLAVLSALANEYTVTSSEGNGARLFRIDASLGLPRTVFSTTGSNDMSSVGLCLIPLPGENGGSLAECVGIVLKAVLRGVSQVYFNPHWESGLVLVLAFLVCSPIGGLCALVGSATGLGIGALLGAPPSELAIGLWGFNAVIGAMAVPVFYRFSARTCVVIVACAATCTLLKGTWGLLLAPVGLPGLTLPFCTGALVWLLVGWPTRVPVLEATLPEVTSDVKCDGCCRCKCMNRRQATGAIVQPNEDNPPSSPTRWQGFQNMRQSTRFLFSRDPSLVQLGEAQIVRPVAASSNAWQNLRRSTRVIRVTPFSSQPDDSRIRDITSNLAGTASQSAFPDRSRRGILSTTVPLAAILEVPTLPDPSHAK
jgi:urea transporter